ncbi:MAG: HD domain-containing phosphohydrolase [Bdellovibrionota bacterium]|nr:HD domain-containing phosphohydrolase [Bdellovibrionota bacterium]
MAKVVVLDKGEELFKMVSLFIESEFETEVESSESFEKYLKEDDLTLFICDYTFVIDYKEEFEGLQKDDTKRKFIVLEDNLLFGDQEKKEVTETLSFCKHGFCHRDLVKQKFLELIESFMGQKLVKVESEYSKVAINYFFKSKQALVDTYVKIGKEKFVKIVNRGEDIPDEVMEHITNKGVRFFYVKKVDFKECFKSIILGISGGTKAGVEGNLSNQFDSVENVHTALKSLGVSEHVLELADETVEVAKRTLEEQTSLPEFLKAFLKNKNYISELSTLTSYLSISCLNELPWGNPKTFTKFALASILQDAGLQDERLAKVCHLESEEFKGLSEAEKKIVIEHPSKAVEILDSLDGMDQDIKDIVMQHHERPNGKGFPWGLKDNELNPLSNLYIICHEYAHRIITYGLNLQTMKAIDKDFREMFSSGAYAKPYKAFLDVFSSKR